MLRDICAENPAGGQASFDLMSQIKHIPEKSDGELNLAVLPQAWSRPPQTTFTTATMTGMGNILLLALGCLTIAGCRVKNASHEVRSEAEVRAFAFLQREVPAWSKENGCFSCHNNGDAARALYAATRQGYRVAAGTLADTTAWVLQPNRWEDNKGDPGFSDQRLANLQFAASLLAAFESGYTKDRETLRLAGRKVAADQNPDGSWAIEPSNPVGSPATHGTTLATHLGAQILKQGGSAETKAALARAESWLRSVPIDNVPAAATILLSSTSAFDGSSRLRRDESLNLIIRAQASGGGWGPYSDSPPEPFDTALVLLALAEMRDAPGVRDLIRQGRTFLITQQQSDGGWPATTRPPGGTSYAQRLSTTGWVTQALLATKD